jgi:hypothetical protein
MEGGKKEAYQKILANQIAETKQRQLRAALRHDLTIALIDAVRRNPPRIDLSEIELVLKPGKTFGDTTADCVTCVTCITS